MKPLTALILLLTASSVHSQGHVWVVDDGGGPGVDFTDLQAAIDAAADGDLVLVEDGTYGGCHLKDRAITVCAETGASVQVSAVLVEDLGPGKRTRVQGLRSEGFSGAPCRIQDSAGLVWVEDCVFEPPVGEDQQPGISVSNCPSVILVDVVARGQDVPGGISSVLWSAPNSGPGLWLQAAGVHAFRCTFEGGRGAIYLLPPSFIVHSTPGEAGVSISDALLVLSASLAKGGQGGPPVYSSISLSCFGGQGGPGMRGNCFGGCPEVLAQESSILGGPGGTPQPFSGCSDDGPAGPSLSGTVLLTTIPSAALEMQAPSPVRESTTLNIMLDGPPSAPVFLGVAAEPGALVTPILGTTLVLAPPILGLALGVLPPSGQMLVSLPLHELPPGIESMVFHGQAAYLDPLNAVVLGQGGMVVLLDGSF